MQKLTFPLVVSLLLHLALGGILYVVSTWQQSKPKVVQVQLNAPKKATPTTQKKAVNAVSIDQKAVEKRLAELKKQQQQKKRAEAERIRKLEKRAANARKKREAEAKRIKKLERERKQKEKEKKQAEAQAKKAREQQQRENELAEKAKQEKEAQQKAAKAAAEKRQKEEEAAKKAQQERERKAQQAREKALAEQLLQEQLAAEQAALNKVRQRQVISEVEKYTAMIKQSIQQHLLVDQNMQGKSCRVNIKLAFNGLVTSVSALEGEAKVCDAAVRAVRRADTVPMSKDRAVFEKLKNINLTVSPEF